MHDCESKPKPTKFREILETGKRLCMSSIQKTNILWILIGLFENYQELYVVLVIHNLHNQFSINPLFSVMQGRKGRVLNPPMFFLQARFHLERVSDLL
jgi:hypothetical protein